MISTTKCISCDHRFVVDDSLPHAQVRSAFADDLVNHAMSEHVLPGVEQMLVVDALSRPEGQQPPPVRCPVCGVPDPRENPNLFVCDRVSINQCCSHTCWDRA